MSTEITAEELQQQLSSVTAERDILRELLLNDHCEAIHHEKVIHGIDADYQRWEVSVSLYDPLPKGWKHEDLNTPRLSLEQALDAYIQDRIKATLR